jgi:glycerophosphoryl diester phosphodiesterase
MISLPDRLNTRESLGSPALAIPSAPCHHRVIVQQLLPSLLATPIAFGHRGAGAHAQDNTLESFRLALTLGATGLESDVWITADGVPVLDHDGEVRIGRRRRTITDLRRDELPEHIPTVVDLLALVGEREHVALDLKHPGSGPVVIEVVREARPDVLPRLWLHDPDVEPLRALRALDPDVRLVNSTRITRIKEGPERRAATLAELGIDGVNLHRTDWHGGLTTLFHRFGRVAFAWDLQFEEQLRPCLRMGMDGVFSDHVDVMVDAFKAELGAIPSEL